MSNKLRSRSSHYEVLGVGPNAGAAEIGQAFAARMSLFGAHRLAEASRISTAYEVLRDPVKRRAYDRSIGIGIELEPRQFGFAVAPPRWAPFIAVPEPGAPPASATTAMPPVEPHVIGDTSPDLPADPRAAAISATLRELARPIDSSKPPAPAADLNAAAGVDRPVDQIAVARDFERDPFPGSEHVAGWKKPALVVGGLVLGAGLVGALAGLSVRDNAEAAQAEPTVTGNRLPLKPAPVQDPSSAPATAAPSSTRERKPAVGSSPAARARPTKWAERIAHQLSVDGQGAGAPTDVPAPVPAPGIVEASMPLSSAAIARTIERIGYPCGEVASTEAAATPGVFRVTCTSGHSFRATPVRGRYRFRRIGEG